jgi:putative ABC transport system permease protein
VVAGALAGAITGFLHTRFQVNALLAGVLTSTGLYSVSLFVMGSGSLSLAAAPTLVTQAQGLAVRLGLPETVTLLGTEVQASSIAALVLMALLAAACGLALTRFLGTDLGTAMRAAGNNPRMARAVAIEVEAMVVLGLGVSNGLIGLSGALIAQYQGFANVTMGVGAIVTGLANLMVGETLLGRRSTGRWVTGAVVGAVAFRLLVAAAIRAGLDADALKLVTAVFVLGVLILPQWGARMRRSRPAGASRG